MKAKTEATFDKDELQYMVYTYLKDHHDIECDQEEIILMVDQLVATFTYYQEV